MKKTLLAAAIVFAWCGSAFAFPAAAPAGAQTADQPGLLHLVDHRSHHHSDRHHSDRHRSDDAIGWSARARVVAFAAARQRQHAVEGKLVARSRPFARWCNDPHIGSQAACRRGHLLEAGSAVAIIVADQDAHS